MSERHQEYEYRPSWGMIVGFIILAGSVIWIEVISFFTFFHTFLSLCPMGLANTLTICLLGTLLVSVGVFAAVLVVRTIVHGRRRSRRIILRETSIDVPMRPWSSQCACVPYDDITMISWGWWLGHKGIRVKHSGGTIVIRGCELPADGDADEILHTLSEKTSLTVVPPKWWPIQFSLSSMFLVITGAAVLLGMGAWIEAPLDWQLCLWLPIAGLTFWGIACWLVTWAPRYARVFAVGFVLGAILEWTAIDYYVQHDLIRFSPNTYTPQGWYPVQVPIERMLLACTGAQLGLRMMLSGMLIGCVASGVLCGGAVLATWFLAGLVRTVCKSAKGLAV